ncbi:MAG: outer membrane protein transport protein [Verrucomicrobiota bacterium]
MNKRVASGLLMGLCVVSREGISMANGFRLPDQDAFATARGEAYVATADNASAVYYNPAGLTQQEGFNLRGGLYGIYLNPSFTPPPGSPNAGSTYHIDKHMAGVPQVFASYGLEEVPLSFGLGVYAPYGLSLEWPQDTGFRTIALSSQLQYIRINPTAAYEVIPGLSVGAGLTVNYANLSLEQGLVPTLNNNYYKFSGDGWAVGYNVGVLWKALDQLSFGATFRSQTGFNLQGTTTTEWQFLPQNPTTRSANADFTFPLNVVVGMSYRPTEKWNLEFDADYTDWSSIGTVVIHQSAPVPPLIPQDVVNVLDWQPSWMYELGVTRYLGDHWQVSAGYVRNNNSVPNAHYTPYVTDLTRNFFSVGGGYKGGVVSVDLAYQFCYGPNHTVTGSAPSLTGQTADGTYNFYSSAFLLTVGLHF